MHYKQLSVSQYTTNMKLSPMAYNQTEIPLSSICPFQSLSLSLSHHCGFELGKKPIIIYLSMSLFISMSVSFHPSFFLSPHIPMAWNQTEIPFSHPSISSFPLFHSCSHHPFLSPSPYGSKPSYLFIFTSISLSIHFFYSSLIFSMQGQGGEGGGGLSIPPSNVVCLVISKTSQVRV